MARSTFEQKLKRLMRDYGYELDGETLYASRIAWYPRRAVRQGFRSAFDAATWLCPIINQVSYTDEFVRLTTPESETTNVERSSINCNGKD